MPRGSLSTCQMGRPKSKETASSTRVWAKTPHLTFPADGKWHAYEHYLRRAEGCRTVGHARQCSHGYTAMTLLQRLIWHLSNTRLIPLTAKPQVYSFGPRSLNRVTAVSHHQLLMNGNNDFPNFPRCTDLGCCPALIASSIVIFRPRCEGFERHMVN